MAMKKKQPASSKEVKAALLSEDERYRYWLIRNWDRKKLPICFIGLNPSTADAKEDDATVRLWRGYATRWGYGSFVAVNLFAFRATKPKDMLKAKDPVGPDNDAHLMTMALRSAYVVACWGTGAPAERVEEVCAMFKERGVSLWCLEKTKDGHPAHPLRKSKDLTMVVWRNHRFDYESDQG
jgi:hypothetical protein